MLQASVTFTLALLPYDKEIVKANTVEITSISFSTAFVEGVSGSVKIPTTPKGLISFRQHLYGLQF